LIMNRECLLNSKGFKNSKISIIDILISLFYYFIIFLPILGFTADPGANHYDDNRRRCSLHRRGWSATRGQTVRDLAQGSGSLPDGPNGPRVHKGGGVRRLDLAPGRDPVGEERSLVLFRVDWPN
jgi:hypothetical protein